MAKCMIMRRGGAGASGLPEFTYTGAYTLLDDGDGNWRIKFLTSGTLAMAKDCTIDVFCVGGGSSGCGYSGGSSTNRGAGGGGGYTATYSAVVLEAGVEIPVVIGAGGVTQNTQAGKTSFMHDSIYYANGGISRNGGQGGLGGSGGGGQIGIGGSDGGDGAGTDAGTGQGSTTREFGESTGDLYAGGGGGYLRVGGAGGGADGTMSEGGYGSDAVANTGGGGGGCGKNYYYGKGGSGIVAIRNHREAAA